MIYAAIEIIFLLRYSLCDGFFSFAHKYSGDYTQHSFGYRKILGGIIHIGINCFSLVDACGNSALFYKVIFIFSRCSYTSYCYSICYKWK